MSIQSLKVNTKAFTLVELIVVITILVILGTIAFLNLGGFSASARDSQRTSDLNQINQQIMTLQAKSAMPYTTMLTYSESNTLSGASLKIAGFSGSQISTGSTYMGGEISYTVLGMDSAKFSDPVSGSKYRMAATSLKGGAYEIAAKLEETATALVIGTYQPRDTTTAGSGVITGTGILTITLGLNDMGKFQVGDAISNGPTTGTINKLISNGTNGIVISTTNQFNATGSLTLLEPTESAGLIANGSNAVVTNKGINLPY